MAYSTVAVANAFIQRAIDGRIVDLTPMKLQKLMFYVQSWSLKIYDKPVIDDFFSKWQYGPVIPSLYHDVKMYGANSIDKKITSVIASNGTTLVVAPIVPDSDVTTNQLIDKIVEVYGPLRGAQLSYLTHEPKTAWSLTAVNGAVMSNELLKKCIE
ncbi:MAG: DUF4065 domain-containing protein [Enterobacteriaceae bacterium]|jgi:uncharacterized phage-associated protein|nr:DUF4065 domain-containing protein [Enterobacteriaceae bacterium]